MVHRPSPARDRAAAGRALGLQGGQRVRVGIGLRRFGAESLREWLIGDLLVFLFVVAFLNLRSAAKPDAYSAAVWDLLNVVLFFVASAIFAWNS